MVKKVVIDLLSIFGTCTPDIAEPGNLICDGIKAAKSLRNRKYYDPLPSVSYLCPIPECCKQKRELRRDLNKLRSSVNLSNMISLSSEDVMLITIQAYKNSGLGKVPDEIIYVVSKHLYHSLIEVCKKVSTIIRRKQAVDDEYNYLRERMIVLCELMYQIETSVPDIDITHIPFVKNKKAIY